MRLRSLLVLPALVGIVFPCAAAAQVNTRPRTLPSLERAKARADAKLPAPSPRAAPTPRTQVPPTLNFDGLASTSNADWAGYTPPDPTGAIGPSHYIELVNSMIGVYNSSDGTPVSDPTDLQTFLIDNGLTDLDPGVNHDDAGDSIFDVQVQWDRHSNRWLIAADDVEESGMTHLVFGWSTSTNPADPWCVWRTGASMQFDDFPKLGHSDSLLLIGTNVFSKFDEGGYLMSRVWAIHKPATTGTSCGSRPQLTKFDNLGFTPVPANAGDGSPAGYVVSAGSRSIRLYTVTDNAGTPVIDGPKSITVPGYSPPPNVQQPGTTAVLDSQDGRLTQAVAMTDPGSGDEMVWTQHTVASADGRRAEVRWYEVDASATTPSVAQQGTIADPSNSVFNAAISPADDGTTAAIQYNVGGRFHLVQTRAQSRDSGTMENEITLGTSTAVDADFTCTQGGGPCRWGDYAGASPDPSATGVVWGTNQLNGSTQPGGDPSWTTLNFALEFGGTDPPPGTSADGFPFVTNDTTPVFNFASSETGSTFECQLDGQGGFAPCTPGHPFGPALPEGPHTLAVRAIDALGQPDPTDPPAHGSFTIDLTPPETLLDAGPPASSTQTVASFAFHSYDSQATFECSLDFTAFKPCASPYVTPALALGQHDARIRAVDAAGNRDPSPAEESFAVVAPPVIVPTKPATPKVVVSVRSQRASRSGRVSVRVKCPKGLSSSCRGTIVLTFHSRALARHRFRVRVGHTATVHVKLTSRAFKLLKHKKRLRVRATFRFSSPAKRLTKTFRLSAPRSRRS